MSNDPQFLLKKADKLDNRFTDESPDGIMVGLFAHVDIAKLAEKLPAFDEERLQPFLAQCTGSARRLLALVGQPAKRSSPASRWLFA